MSIKVTTKQEAIQALGRIDYMAGQLEAMDISRMKINDVPVIQFKAGALRQFSKEIWGCTNTIRKLFVDE